MDKQAIDFMNFVNEEIMDCCKSALWCEVLPHLYSMYYHRAEGIYRIGIVYCGVYGVDEQLVLYPNQVLATLRKEATDGE